MSETVEDRDEATMIAAVLAGNTRQFYDLIRPYERTVYKMAFSMLKDEAEAEDVAQDAFLKAYRHLAHFRAESKFSTWLISITLNEARARLRRKQLTRMDSLDETFDDDRPANPALLRDWREIPSETLERQEVRSILRQAIDNLPLIYREVFMLREVEEFSVNESAAALGISIAAVKVRLHRARMMLQRRLAPELKSISPAKRRWLPWF